MVREKLKLVPNNPGCYLMKNKAGVIIYVGKAKNLKNRLSSYFNGTHVGKTKKLVEEIDDFEYIIVNSENESLILELNLIKKYDPKYNVLLRDDKSYPYIELTEDKIPKLMVVRNVNRKKKVTNLFGPYPNVTAAKKTVNLLNRVYPLKKCDKIPKKECLYYHINECLGYCINHVPAAKINEMKSEIISFLKGDQSLIKKKIKANMLKYSDNLEYEKAKEMKELLDYIDITLTNQMVEIKDNKAIDVFGYYVKNDYMAVQVFFIRNGKIIGRHSKIIPLIECATDELNRYIASFYEGGVLLPNYIIVPDICDANLLNEYLLVNVIKPARGIKNNLVKLACSNACDALKLNFELIRKNDEKTTIANDELKDLLGLDKLDRIDIFDNSNLFGSYNVSCMVVFKDGIPSKNEYRKYKISIDKNDDYNTMKEAIYRRYYKMILEDLERPDLIIVDGGINQINACQEILASLNLGIAVLGLKKNDLHQTEALVFNNQELKIDKKSNLFYLLERMQDEVHRFTISYHKTIRSKGALSSALDNVKGLGEKRKKELFKRYKTISKIKALSLKELDVYLPHKVAIELKSYLDKKNY